MQKTLEQEARRLAVLIRDSEGHDGTEQLVDTLEPLFRLFGDNGHDADGTAFSRGDVFMAVRRSVFLWDGKRDFIPYLETTVRNAHNDLSVRYQKTAGARSRASLRMQGHMRGATTVSLATDEGGEIDVPDTRDATGRGFRSDETRVAFDALMERANLPALVKEGIYLLAEGLSQTEVSLHFGKSPSWFSVNIGRYLRSNPELSAQFRSVLSA